MLSDSGCREVAWLLTHVPQYFDTALYSHIEPLSASIKCPTEAVTVVPAFCNRLGHQHGGAAATIFDLLTTIAIAPLSKPGKFGYPGVSRTLNCTYLRPVTMGMKVRVDCEIVSWGRNLCTIRGVMRRVKDGAGWLDDGRVGSGDVLVLCEHGKVNIDPPAVDEVQSKL